MSAVSVLLKKELTDSLRDRRTLAMLLLMPVLLYPTLLLAIGGITQAGKERLKKKELTVAVASDDAAAFLAERPLPEHTHYTRMPREQGEAQLREKKLWAIVDAEPGSHDAVAKGGQGKLTVLYTERHDESGEALRRLREVLDEVNHLALKVRLDEAKLPESFAEPVLTQAKDIDFDQNLGPVIASKILPSLLIMMLFIGAFYPAIDVTAGEKERGTLETLLVSPVRPMEVMAAKYLTVSIISVAAAVANLLAMTATFSFGISMGTKNAAVTFGAAQLLTMAACLLPAALMVSGVSLAIASLARSFKEAQSLLTPVMLIAIFPGMAAMVPGMELNNVTAMVPLLDLALLVKAVVLGTAAPVPVLITCGVIVVCALVGLKLSANAFVSEALRFGGADNWRELFKVRRQ
ncbi:MAG: ABC transporter permease subunit [Myxococcaceae bacterium]